MATVDPAKRTRFHNSFCNAAEEISEGLSTSKYAATDRHWEKWAALCKGVALNPLLVSYRDLVPILNAFVRQ